MRLNQYTYNELRYQIERKNCNNRREIDARNGRDEAPEQP